MIDEAARFCAVCGRVLEQLREKAGHYTYRHALVDEPADHLPVAIRNEEAPAQLRIRCDFCLHEPVTHTLALDRELSIPEANMTWSTDWAMCATCAAFVMADDWRGLRAYVWASQERDLGITLSEETKTRMRVVYRDMRKSMVMIYQEPVA